MIPCIPRMHNYYHFMIPYIPGMNIYAHCLIPYIPDYNNYVHCMTLRQHGPRCGHHGRMGEARHRGRMDGWALGICTVCSTSTPNDHGRHRFPRMGLRDVRPGQPPGIRIIFGTLNGVRSWSPTARSPTRQKSQRPGPSLMRSGKSLILLAFLDPAGLKGSRKL